MDRLLAPLGLAMVFGLAALVQFPFSLNHDAAWHFYTALRVAEGARIGLDIADVNPPMAMWLFSLPGRLVTTLGLPAPLVFRCFVFALAFGALWSTRKDFQQLHSRYGSWIFLLVASALLLLPAYHFGQREHLATLLVMPYLCLAAGRSENRPASAVRAITIGIVAGIGICFKPYFLAVPIAVELWLLWCRRDPIAFLRTEIGAMIGTGLIYVSVVVFFAPDYLLRVVPDALATYGGFDSTPGQALTDFVATLSLPVIALAIALLAARKVNPLAASMLTGAAGFLVAALLQKKGWPYQLMPGAILILVAAAVEISIASRLRSPVIVAIVLACLFPVAINLRDNVDPRGTTARVAALASVLAAKPRASIYGFITSPRDMHPAVLASGARWADAHGVMIFLPGHLAGGHRATAISQNYLDGLIARLDADPPTILAFDNSPRKLGIADPDFDYLEFLARQRGLDALLADYREIQPVGRFRLFRRID
jgi:hypothetical protein